MPSRRKLADALRVLAMDAVQKARSGHPGMPMGMADIAEALWRDELRFNPANPNWFNRDRFVLSNGHGAMLLYGLLHLTGFDLSLDEIQQFRQLNSKTPGHPEYGDTPGVETTTGPLAQGLAMAVGMAIAEQHLAAQFNRDPFNIVDHMTYVFVGDGCLMEGLSHEVCSLAGTLGLGKLIVFYDDNGISIDGDVAGWFTDNTPKRFDAYGWQVIADVDGHDFAAILAAIKEAKSDITQPTLICCRTQIGFGSPNKANTAKAHGAALGEAEVALTRAALNWQHEPFVIPDAIYQAWDQRKRGQGLEDEWNQRFAKYERAYPKLAREFLRRLHQDLPTCWSEKTNTFIHAAQQSVDSMATRKASKACLEAYGPLLPEILGGSADLTDSNCTAWSQSKTIHRGDFSGNYIEYGVREFGMAAISNGMALHRGVLPYSGTFLVFSDYARNAIRLSALMQLRTIYVLTHDSIGLGEDGPTHQPIEHASSLRMIPGLRVWRPCDLTETALAWQQAIEHQGPSCLLLTRQNVSPQSRSLTSINDIARGGYVLLAGSDTPEGIFIATGSEVSLAMAAAKAMALEGMTIRVVSMPCCEVFKKQTVAYRDSVLPPEVKVRVAIEAGVPDYWYQFVGDRGAIVGLTRYGKSAPKEQVFADLGISAECAQQTMLTLLHKSKVCGVG